MAGLQDCRIAEWQEGRIAGMFSGIREDSQMPENHAAILQFCNSELR
jgi:hypothetical protein